MAANEALFREVNEGIARGLWPGEGAKRIRFHCECARPECNTPVLATREQYEEVRAHSRRFLIVDGHELPPAESVVRRTSDYAVVQKREAAGAVAEATDPRRQRAGRG